MRTRPYTSILGGGIATELLKNLDKRKFTEVSRYSSNGCLLQFSLRYSYRYERGRWYGPTYETRSVLTGGMLLTCRGESRKELCLPSFRRSFRLKPFQVANARHFLGRAITRMAREWGAERMRQHDVALVDSAAAPLIQDKRFMDAVAEQEKVFGLSDYGTLTRDDCAKWLEWIAAWKKRHHVKPSPVSKSTL